MERLLRLQEIGYSQIILLALFIIGCWSFDSNAQEFDIRHGDEPQIDRFWKIHADYIKGDITDATVADTYEDYTEDSIGEILHYLAEKVNSVTTGSTIIVPIIGDLYGFQEEFTEEKTSWRVMFPEGKWINSSGTFLCTIWGMSWEDYTLIRGAGYTYRGIQFTLTDGSVWPIGTVGRGLFQLVDIPVTYVFHDFSTSDYVRTPKDAPHEALGLVRF